MATFKVLPKTQLRNAAHFTVMEEFQTMLTSAAFTATKLTSAITQFSAALAEEDKYLKQATASAISKQLANTDAERDKDYMAIKQVVDAWRSVSFEPQTTAATALGLVIDLYKVNTNDHYDQETGLLTNFLTDISTTANAANVKTLGLTEVVAKLKELNELMKTLMVGRADERSSKVNGALKAARTKVNNLYDQLTKLLEGYSALADDPTVYDNFIAKWNTEIVRVRQQIGLNTSSSSTASNGSTSSDSSSSSSDSGNSGSSSDSGNGSGSSSSSGSDSGSSSGDDDNNVVA